MYQGGLHRWTDTIIPLPTEDPGLPRTEFAFCCVVMSSILYTQFLAFKAIRVLCHSDNLSEGLLTTVLSLLPSIKTRCYEYVKLYHWFTANIFSLIKRKNQECPACWPGQFEHERYAEHQDELTFREESKDISAFTKTNDASSYLGKLK